MSTPRSGKKASPDRQESEDLSVSVHIFECGHGDTTLLDLPGKRWALIDCHLSNPRAKQQFFDFLGSRNVTRLDLLCLTHAHRDHFMGMLDVVDYFTRDGRSLGVYCDTGVGPDHVLSVLRAAKRPAREVADFESLHQRLNTLIRDKQLTYYRVDENSYPIYVDEFDERVCFVPIGPSPAVVRDMTRKALQSGTIKGSLNSLSLALVLHLQGGNDSFKLLIAGDADSKALDHAVQSWRRRAEHMKTSWRFDAVKIPHHGSLKSHTTAVFRSGSDTTTRYAAISVGTRFKVLPDRVVMRDYMDAGWSVLTTTKRLEARRRQLALELSGRRGQEKTDVCRQDITLSWSINGGVSFHPPEARVVTAELELYDSAVAR